MAATDPGGRMSARARTDHIHFSFSWAGARKQTSYWDGTPVTYPT